MSSKEAPAAPKEAKRQQPLLRVRALDKAFGATRALRAADFEVAQGEIHALLGENGAGKSTLIKIIAGIYPPDAGSIVGPFGPAAPGRAVAGVAFVHQDLGLVATASVAENVAIGVGYARTAGFIDWRGTRARAARALDAMGCTIDPREMVGRLSAADKSLVAIARALAMDARLLVLDEPTATLPDQDVVRLHDVLRRLKQRNLAIVYVTHRLDEVFRIADRATVLRDGSVRAELDVARTTPRELMGHILGRRIDDMFVQAARPPGEVCLEIDHLRSVHVGPASFTLRRGEVLALAGLRGGGHDVVGRMIAGDVAARGGHIRIDGRPITISAPADALRAGIGFVSSKRIEESLCMGMTLRENLFPNPPLAGFSAIGTYRERSAAGEALRDFDVRPPEPERLIARLSGGNQQKVALARYLAIGRKILILEEPTIGVDVGAKAEIYGLVEAALSDGLAVLLVSSDFEEVAGLSDRIILYDRGRQGDTIEAIGLSAARLSALVSQAGIGR